MKKLLLLSLLLSLVSLSLAQTIDEDFNTGLPTDWTTIDGGENPGTWTHLDQYGINNSGSLELDCYDSGLPNSGRPDDWLITPQITVNENDGVSFWAVCDPDYKDAISVMVSKTGKQAGDFTVEVAAEFELTGDYQKYEFNLTDHPEISPGDQIYIGIHCNSNGSYVGLDNFFVGQLNPTELIYEEFSDSIPDGWTVIDEGTNTNTWTDTSENGYNDSPCLWVDCYDIDLPNSGACDDWLITPQVEVRQGDYLSFWAFGGYAGGDIPDTIFVKISQDGVQKSDFTIMADTLALLNESDMLKFSWLLTDIDNVNAGDMIYVGLHARSNGSRIYLDNFRLGQYVPPRFTEAHATSETAIEVQYDMAVTGQDILLDDISLQGSDGAITFDGYHIDQGDEKTVRFTGASSTMTGDNIPDTLINSSVEDTLAFYSGILPLTYVSLTNPEGTLINDGPVGSFRGIVTYINGNGERVWINDAAGAHHGINTYQGSTSLSDSVGVGDEVLIYGSMSAFDGQTEIYPAFYDSTISTGNDLFDPTLVTGAEIDSSLQADSDPAEKYEGTLIQIDSAQVLEYISMEPEEGDTLYQYVCSDGEGIFLVGSYKHFELYSGDFNQQPMEVGKSYRITGILTNRGGKYRLAPRYEADMAEITRPTGLDELKTAGIEMFPNPVSHQLRIRTRKPADRIVIYNSIGQRIRMVRPNGRRLIRINTGELKQGFYFVTFERHGQVIQTGKLIKSGR